MSVPKHEVEVSMGAGRLAPSPTGAQHLGNARTFLLAYWSARATGKKLILRIEDIDSPRVKQWAIDQAIEDLSWLGIDWDEGPVIQSDRVDHYQAALDRLIQQDMVFPCTCTRKDVETAGSAPHFDHEPRIYPGTCSSWRRGNRIPEDGTFCWRFRAGNHRIEFDDLVLGKQSCRPSQDLGDFPVTQKNGSPSYQLAVVVDDAMMGVNEVVRGDDLLASAFRQIELFAALDYPSPKFAHVPLVVGNDGRRLAKRHGDTRLSTYREQGLNPEKIIQWAKETSGIEPEHFDWCKLHRDKVMVDEPWR